MKGQARFFNSAESTPLPSPGHSEGGQDDTQRQKQGPRQKALRDNNEKLEAGPCLRQASLAECARD